MGIIKSESQGFYPRSVINAMGTLTSLGGCRTRPEVVAAMAEVAGKFVPLGELQQKAGEQIAKILDVEAAMVTSGAAAALTLATAACMVGDDPALTRQLPIPPPKHNIVIQCAHRCPFEKAIATAGASLVQVGDAIRTHPQDLEAALDDNVAAVVYFLQGEMLDSSLSLVETIEIAHAYAVPVIVDAAAELPPKKNLWTLAQNGADLVIFSGSKDLRGPQTSGLVVGRSKLVTAMRAHTAPQEAVIGRPLKAGKEVIAGMARAIELYLAEDEEARFAAWEKIASFLKDQLSTIPGLRLRQFHPSQPYIQPACIPRVGVRFKPDLNENIFDLKNGLWKGNPPIAVEVIQDELWINVHTLTMVEAEIIVQRINKILVSP